MHSSLRPIVFVLAVFCLATLVIADSIGPPPGNTGGPGESDCTQCHNSYPLNSGSGGLTVTSPIEVNPGDTIDITITITDPGQHRWGFQLTALDMWSSEPIGGFLITDPVRTQELIDRNGREYVFHTGAGTDSGTSDASPGWTVQWVAPADNGMDIAVFFYGAAVAADGDGTDANDFVYTDSAFAYYLTPDCFIFTGEVNGDGLIRSNDIIYLVGYLFKSAPTPLPCAAAGDVNCDGGVTSADIIYMVNYVFRGGPLPCDVCPMIPEVWTCP